MNYHLRLLKKKRVIISSTSYHSPLQELLELASELKIEQYSGDVLFDLLCVNGNNSNRFISIFFNGNSFDNKSAKSIETPSNSIIVEQKIFYEEHQSYIFNSVLSSSQQKLYVV
jgi:hypothetical protein